MKFMYYFFIGWPPGQDVNYARLARDLKTQFFSTLTGNLLGFTSVSLDIVK